RVIAGLQYRAAAWAGVATQLFFGFMFIMLYKAFYASGDTAPPMEWSQLVSYTWLQHAFLAIIMLWYQDGELLDAITSGNVAYELCRPYGLFSFWIVRLLAMRLSSVLLRCLPILIIASLLPASYRMSLPASPVAAFLFLLSLLISLFLISAISMFIYILTFVTLSPLGARLMIGVAAEFLQGAVIPIPLMPMWLQKMLNWLPFRYTSDLPFRIYSGNIAGTDALFQIGIEILWVVALFMLGAWAFRRVLRRIVVQGG
ncbi:MAG: ABC transporter permease, partial [Lachnospiraceae bacterium]|nr:ABC transporter permease [Lachnospiraceae bacterium]